MNPSSILVIEDDALNGGLLAEMLVSLGRDTAGIQMTQDEASLMPGIAGASESTQLEIRSGIRATASAPLPRRGRTMPAAAPFIANPNLVERLRTDTPLAPLASETLSGGDEHSYTDSPTLAA
jgi:CheY-like chemotaxis protein